MAVRNHGAGARRAIFLVPAVVLAMLGAAPAAATAAPATPAGKAAARIPSAAYRDVLTKWAVGSVGDPHAARTAAPAGNVGSNVVFLSNLPQLATAISVAFIDNVAFVSTVTGLYSVDISDPANPMIIGAAPQYIWENEHMTADPARKRVFITRDPRGYTSPATSGGTFPEGAIEIYDVSLASQPLLMGYVRLPAGHTSTCIASCDYIWTQGPASGSFNPPDWKGRPVFGTNVSDPLHPVSCPGPLDLHSNDGVTDYAHSVDPDSTGVSWVSGRGHLRGFWTSGSHYDYVTGHNETATPCAPVPYAGGGTNEGNAAEAVIHNSFRDLSASVDGRAGDVVLATEEATVTDCAKSGRFLTYDIGNSHQGQGWLNIATSHFRLTKLDQWTPKGQPGSTGCDSAHWFTERQDHLVAISFYSQGTRFLDVSDPRHITQVAYYNPTATNSWAAYWRPDNVVVIADFGRGLDIVRVNGATTGLPRAAVPTRGDAPARRVAGAASGLPSTAAGGSMAAFAAVAMVGLVALLLVTLQRRRART